MSAKLLPNVSDALFKSLGHLGFQRFAPPLQLRPWVQCYWIARQDRLPEASVSETVYPDGGTTLVFNFANDYPDITFFATQTVGKMIFQGSVNRMGIRFHPGGAFQLLGLGMPDVIGTELSADDLSMHSLLQLRDQLAELSHVSQRLTLIDQWLLDRVKKNNANIGFIQQLLPQLILTPQPLEQLSEHLPISRRQLERKFQLEVGFSPNQLKQLHRVKIARTLISQRPEQSLTDIGQDAGFYDQAHFIRHFHKITGQTPGEYRQRKMSQIYNSTKP
ncbi:helix-turn-helix domain-containing protein [Cellvibrio fibrivorans]|uniref:AraC-like DNA-binding protein n=1 Tax=Cellvibrio fibrivorans TaxID=126350 RepID=A0ABU1V1M7_9GAMM|nr:helix-turn-helix domain-containing protein [Cellvibrio fibrivorans]MDR7091350.1 AraC-like DNA-binding protein [Cellvibrio fibrivorans]